MSVSVRHDSSFREEIGFIILHYKCSESFGNGKSFLYDYWVHSLKFNEYTQKNSQPEMVPDCEHKIWFLRYVQAINE